MSADPFDPPAAPHMADYDGTIFRPDQRPSQNRLGGWCPFCKLEMAPGRAGKGFRFGPGGSLYNRGHVGCVDGHPQNMNALVRQDGSLPPGRAEGTWDDLRVAVKRGEVAGVDYDPARPRDRRVRWNVKGDNA